MERLLVLLLIILKEAGPTAACICWLGTCYCSSRGLSSVPQDLPTSTTHLDLSSNVIATLSQSDFSRYSRLVTLSLRNNQISTINSGAFCNLTRLTHLHLNNNQLTILRADMFVGLGKLDKFDLHYNNIHSIEAGTFHCMSKLRALTLYYNNISTIAAEAFVNLPRLEYLSLHDNQITSLPSDVFAGLDSLQELSLHYNNISTIAAGTFANLHKLERLYISHNRISTFPSDLLSNLNILKLSDNQIQTLPAMAYDILAPIEIVDISNNPWQCDCRMYPFKQRMTGLPDFESQIQCAASVLEDKSLLHDVTPEDLICEICERPLGAFFLSGSLGVVVGIFLNLIVSHVIWPRCKNRERKISPAPAPITVPTPITAQDTHTDIDCAQAGRDVTETGAAESDDVDRAQGPALDDLDLGYRLVRPSLPPITGTGVD